MHGIKYIILDIDGTLTDGKIYYLSSGEEMKAFNIKDGLAITVAQKCGIIIVVITGRESEIVERRMKELGVKEIYQGISDKKTFIKKYASENGVKLEECGYIGDDLNDLGCMKLMGFTACPNDACEEIRQIADYVAKQNAGYGAVREILEYVMKVNGLWKNVVKQYE